MTSKRDRYERANMRGGLGVRKRLSEDSLRETYRLNGVQTGSVVVRAHDKYRGDMTKGFDVGILVRRTAAVATIHWAGDEEATNYNQGDARYEVDRGRWKFLGLMGPNPLDPSDPVSTALTALRQSISIPASASSDDATPPTEETEMPEKMSNAAVERAAAKKALSNGELKDRETYTAKQIAGRCGTDAKTMRKFFRSAHSTVEPVGQGGRYEFDAKDFPKIKREFDAWQSKSKARTKPTPKSEPVITPVTDDGPNEERYYEGDEPPHPDTMHEFTEDMGDDEPSDDELAALENDELDLDDLDAND